MIDIQSELKSVYDCLNESDLTQRATLYETYSRLVQIGRRSEEIKKKLAGRIVSDGSVLESIELMIEDCVEDENSFDESTTLQRIQNVVIGMNGRIDLHFVNDCGVVADVRMQVLDFIKKLMEDNKNER